MSGRTLEQMVPAWEWAFGALTGGQLSRINFVENSDQVEVGDARDLIRLPRELPYQLDGMTPFDWYRMALIHRAAHYEFGSFSLGLDDLPAGVTIVGEDGEDGDEGREQQDGESGLEFILAHLSDWLLAERIFAELEDLRIEAHLHRLYGGFREHLAAIQAAELERRPPLLELAPQSLALELLCRRSLRWDLAAVEIPALLAPFARTLQGAASHLQRRGSTVADSTLWMLDLYRELSRLPHLAPAYDQMEVVGPGVGSRVPAVESVDWETRVQLEGQEELDRPWVPLPTYRDGMGFRHSSQTTTGRMESASIFRFIPGSGQDDSRPDVEISSWGEDEEERPQRPEPGEHEHYELVEHHYHAPVGRLRYGGGRSFLYPEWDGERGEYRPNWCRVRESLARPGMGSSVYQQVIREHRTELSRLRRRAERLVHEGRKTVRRSKWGDDIDIDAAIEAVADLNAGLPPSPNVHISREPMERDVALLTLFDLSSSTAERLPLPSDGQSASDLSLSFGASRRILDIELESMALLMAAMAATGDQLGVYGFSSSGRKDVQFVIFKDLEERFTSRVSRRLDDVKPIHSTRMGPAVRHATRKLQKNEANTRILLLVCDGRPYDLDYAPDGAAYPDQEYAINDTRRALDEAVAAGLRVKVLGIDHNETHYVREMCGPQVSYELLPRVEMLPQRMMSLYKDLSI